MPETVICRTAAHQVGAAGARMLATRSRALHRRGGGHGLVTTCTGGGQRLAAVSERIA